MADQQSFVHATCPKCSGFYVFAYIKREKECLIAHFKDSFSEFSMHDPVDILRYLLQNNGFKQFEWLIHHPETGKLLADAVADDCVRCDLLLTCIKNGYGTSFTFLLENGFLSAKHHHCGVHRNSVSDVIQIRESRYDDFLTLVNEYEGMEAMYDVKDPGMM